MSRSFLFRYPEVFFSPRPVTYIRPWKQGSGANLNASMDERAAELARWIIENNATVRSAAERFGVSKSTVHKDMQDRLRDIDLLLYEKVRLVLDKNKAERHLRGGDATRRKYKGE